MTIPEAMACHPTNREADGAIAMQVDSFVPTQSAFGFPIYVAPLSAGSIQRTCQDTLDFIQVPDYPGSIHTFALTHSRRKSCSTLAVAYLSLVGRESILQMHKEDNRMSVYVIAQGKIEDRGMLDQYGEQVVPTIKSHQGRIVAIDEEPEVERGRSSIRAPLFWSFHR